MYIRQNFEISVSYKILYLAIDETESKRTEIRQTFVISGAETGFKAVGTRSDGLKEGNRRKGAKGGVKKIGAEASFRRRREAKG